MEWETDSTVFAAGSDTSAMQRWSKFRRFVGYDEVSVQAFDEGVTERMIAIELLIRAADGPAPRAYLRRSQHDTSDRSP